ncbi:D-amino-acid dehydrogenase [Diaporthe sp. PMI_573]|nr:D-amino-acid dehydrogenase [Diaporthaceae sp. PMI_573]
MQSRSIIRLGRSLTSSSRSATMSSTQQTQQRDITIIGGGIIGCSTAYFLTRHPSYSPKTHRITLLEAASTNSGGRTEDSITDPGTLVDPARAQKINPAHDGIAGGSSGKAGGLLAKWAFPPNIVPLSFKLHDELAKEHDGAARWGYRRCYASQVECRARMPGGLGGKDSVQADHDTANTEGVTRGLHKDHRKTISKLKTLGAPEDLDWLDTGDSLVAYNGMGTPDDTAQVHPELFTRSMAQLAEEKGVKIVTGARVTAITKGSNGRVESVTYTKDGKDEQLPTTDCIVAAGPWTSRLLPSIPVQSSRAHSIVIKTPKTVSPYALFTSIALPAGFPSPSQQKPIKRSQTVEPEIYARPDGTAYACGPTDSTVPLPLTTAEVEVDRARCDDIAAQVGAISDELGSDGEVLARQACYLPQGGPFIGPVPGHQGVVVAAGHTCWGIQNAPGTGNLVSEIVFDGKAVSAQLGGCDPSRVL